MEILNTIFINTGSLVDIELGLRARNWKTKIYTPLHRVVEFQHFDDVGGVDFCLDSKMDTSADIDYVMGEFSKIEKFIYKEIGLKQ